MTETHAPSPARSVRAAPGRERVYRRNFLFFLVDFVLFGVAFSFIDAATVIPDFVRNLTDSEILIAFSSQMYEVGWLLPQLLVARHLVRVESKKWWFVGPSIPVRALMLILAWSIVLLGPNRRGMILALFIVFYGLSALGDGLVSVPWMDLTGSSLDDKRRARLFGWGNAIMGVVVLGVAPLIQVVLGSSGLGFPNDYALLFALSGTFFFVGSPLCMFVRELPGGKAQESVPSLREYLPDLLRVLREDHPYRAMIIVGILSTLFRLAAPFYIGVATERLAMPSDVAVSRLLFAHTLGGVCGALLLSWLGDQRNLLYIRLMLLTSTMVPVLALFATLLGPAPLYFAFWFDGLAAWSLGLGFIHWVITYASHEQRVIYTGLFNSFSAVGFLAAPIIGGLLAETLGYEAAFIAALIVIAGALYISLRHIE
jgi:MFS family permease